MGVDDGSSSDGAWQGSAGCGAGSVRARTASYEGRVRRHWIARQDRCRMIPRCAESLPNKAAPAAARRTALRELKRMDACNPGRLPVPFSTTGPLPAPQP